MSSVSNRHMHSECFTIVEAKQRSLRCEELEECENVHEEKPCFQQNGVPPHTANNTVA